MDSGRLNETMQHKQSEDHFPWVIVRYITRNKQDQYYNDET